MLHDFTNSLHINKCSAAGNHIGLYVIGPKTTPWSCKESNWRNNDIGVRIEGGAAVQIENCMIESNNSYGDDYVAAGAERSSARGWEHHSEAPT
jgi:hypothetical protein